jgi:hypothetical protein
MQRGWMGANFRACLKRMIKREINPFLRVLLKEFASFMLENASQTHWG